MKEFAPLGASWSGRRVAVWGAARSGIAAANLLVAHGAKVVLSDIVRDPSPEGVDPRVELVGGGNVFEGADLVVPSPGIKPSVPAMTRLLESGIRIASEIEVAASFAQAPLIAITGTDGKSTTTAMIGAAIEACGRQAVVCGNIGEPFSAHVTEATPDGFLVVEVSAFQLWSAGYFRPQVAVVTNVAEDHAEYFSSDTLAYEWSKARVLGDQLAGDAAILRIDDPVVSAFLTADGVRRIGFAPMRLERGWGCADGWLTRDGERVMEAAGLLVPGAHNIANALATLATGDALGLPQEELARGLRAFSGLPHRLQHVATIKGVGYYDDSKATNPHAARVGLAALDGPLIVITGGYEKGLDLGDYLDVLVKRARWVLLCGHTAERTERELGGRARTEVFENMEAAVGRAAEVARPGDAVVLSPAASSFDYYTSYAHRGEVFCEAVRKLAGA